MPYDLFVSYSRHDDQIKVAGSSGQHEQACIAAQSSLRLTNDAQTRAEVLRSLQSAYNALPGYRLPSFNKISLLKMEPNPAAIMHRQ